MVIRASAAQWPNFSHALRRKTPSAFAKVAPWWSASQFGNAEMKLMELKPCRFRYATASSKLMPEAGA